MQGLLVKLRLFLHEPRPVPLLPTHGQAARVVHAAIGRWAVETRAVVASSCWGHLGSLGTEMGIVRALSPLNGALCTCRERRRCKGGRKSHGHAGQPRVGLGRCLAGKGGMGSLGVVEADPLTDDL